MIGISHPDRASAARALLAMALFCAALFIAPAVAAAASIEDARPTPAPMQARNSAGGAEVTVRDRRGGGPIYKRVKERLEQAELPQLDGRSLRLTRGTAVLFVEGAFATPAIISNDAAIRRAGEQSFPDELPVLRQSGSSGRREYRVELTVEIDGRSIEARGVASFMGNVGESRQLRKAIDAAIDELIAGLSRPVG